MHAAPKVFPNVRCSCMVASSDIFGVHAAYRCCKVNPVSDKIMFPGNSCVRSALHATCRSALNNNRQSRNAANLPIAKYNHVIVTNRERKCADTIGAVLVPWAGHFQCAVSSTHFTKSLSDCSWQVRYWSLTSLNITQMIS